MSVEFLETPHWCMVHTMSKSRGPHKGTKLSYKSASKLFV